MANASIVSSAPTAPGINLPDTMKPITKTDKVVNVLKEFFGEEVVKFDPNSDQLISAETFQHFQERREFERMVVRTYNALEKLDGWWLWVARLRQGMKYNQQVSVNIFPKRPLIRTPEEVPPEMWQHKTEQWSFTMDRYTAGFEVLGDMWAYGAEYIANILSEKAANIIAGTAISLKMKITSTIQRMKMPWQIRNHMKEPTFNTLKEASQEERHTYCSLSRRDKGLFALNQRAQKYASLNQYQFNTLVVPLERSNHFHRRHTSRKPSELEMTMPSNSSHSAPRS